jgi:hypothetical protein
MYCPKCGNQIDDGSAACPNCGFVFVHVPKGDDNPTGGMKFLCFLFPLIGLILFIVWKNDYPRKSKSYGKAALFGFVCGSIIWFLLLMLGTCAGMGY